MPLLGFSLQNTRGAFRTSHPFSRGCEICPWQLQSFLWHDARPGYEDISSDSGKRLRKFIFDRGTMPVAQCQWNNARSGFCSVFHCLAQCCIGFGTMPDVVILAQRLKWSAFVAQIESENPHVSHFYSACSEAVWQCARFGCLYLVSQLTLFGFSLRDTRGTPPASHPFSMRDWSLAATIIAVAQGHDKFFGGATSDCLVLHMVHLYLVQHFS